MSSGIAAAHPGGGVTAILFEVGGVNPPIFIHDHGRGTGIRMACVPAIQKNTAVSQPYRVGDDFEVSLEPSVALSEYTAKLILRTDILRDFLH